MKPPLVLRIPKAVGWNRFDTTLFPPPMIHSKEDFCKMNILNKNQVDALFQCEAVLIGTEDCVLAFRAETLFGEGAKA